MHYLLANRICYYCGNWHFVFLVYFPSSSGPLIFWVFDDCVIIWIISTTRAGDRSRQYWELARHSQPEDSDTAGAQKEPYNNADFCSVRGRPENGVRLSGEWAPLESADAPISSSGMRSGSPSLSPFPLFGSREVTKSYHLLPLIPMKGPSWDSDKDPICLSACSAARLPNALSVVLSMRNERAVPFDPICMAGKFQWARLIIFGLRRSSSPKMSIWCCW